MSALGGKRTFAEARDNAIVMTLDHDDRDRLVVRVCASFIIGLGLVGMAVMATNGPAFGFGVAFLGLFYALPFLLIVGASAYLFAASVIDDPLAWSAGAVLISTTLCYFLIDNGWQLALLTSVASATVFRIWGVRPFLVSDDRC